MKTSISLLAVAMSATAMMQCALPADANEADHPIPAGALKADPWVTPPRNLEETKSRVAELRARYAPYLRSLPEKLDVRARQDLGGPATCSPHCRSRGVAT